MPQATLSIPPSVEHVRLARLVAVAAARRVGLSDEQIDDVRLAVGEGVTRAVQRHLAEHVAQDVSLGMIEIDDEFTIVITDHVGSAVPETDDGIALALIRALVPDVEDAGAVLSLRWVRSA